MTTHSDSSSTTDPPGDRVIELRLPSRLGYEKVAMDTASSLAKRMGFTQDRVDALRTAVSEAVTNAIEHGNDEQVAMKVFVLLMARGGELIVSVADQGLQVLSEERTLFAPKIEDALAGPERGGWGIWLIRELVDEVEFTTAPSGGNQVRMVIHLEQ
jgi:serine/threonine-protein kinase RsbW